MYQVCQAVPPIAFNFLNHDSKIHDTNRGYAMHHLGACASEGSVSVVFHCKEFLASLFRFNSMSDKSRELLYVSIATTSYFTVLQSLLNHLLLICSHLKWINLCELFNVSKKKNILAF